jgi:hypothetical protein
MDEEPGGIKICGHNGAIFCTVPHCGKLIITHVAEVVLLYPVLFLFRRAFLHLVNKIDFNKLLRH